METLVLDGKSFVKASKAARDLGYTADYVGQLCRSGQVSAHLVGRTWYVDPTELGTHRVEKKRISRVKAREQAHRSIEEHRKRLTVQQSDMARIPSKIHYERDDGDLIPAVRKLQIEETKVRGEFKKAQYETKAEEPYEILNAGDKIVMSGKLQIVDLGEEETKEEGVTILHPKIERKNKEQSADYNQSEPGNSVLDATPQPPSFVERLEQLEEVSHRELTRTEDSSIPVEQASREQKVSWYSYVFLILATLACSTAALAFESQWIYTFENSKVISVESRIGFNLHSAISKIGLKI